MAMYINKLLKSISVIKKEFKLPEYWIEYYKSEKKVKEFYETVIEHIQNLNIPVEENKNLLSMVQLFLHHFTAYDHKESEISNTGSLLKTIAILPFIKKECGFNGIMLLPHFLRSRKFMKGDSASPYSVKDYYKIDDELVEDYLNIDPEIMFGAFVECAHKCGIKVFIDMVPRTAARDSLWILENPEWFYWIKPENSERLVSLLQTEIKNLSNATSMTDEVIEEVVNGLPIDDIMNVFEWDPKSQNPEKWNKFVEKYKDDENFLDKIVEEFGVITPPCTSDCVNDPQPAWTDVTPLRLYRDYFEVLEKKYGSKLKDHPPFFIQPVLKSSNFPGKIPVKDLWDKICEIPHHYYEKFGVDGLRGDMFHALPSELIDGMKKRLKDPNFIWIMENLDNKAGNDLSVQHEFDFYTGNLFAVINEDADSLKYFLEQTNSFQTGILGMPVIGDSVPVLSRNVNKATLQLALAGFFPKSVYGVTADTLIGNTLPLNYGLGFTQDMQKEFDEKLKQAGRKLSYFNKDNLTSEWNDKSSNLFDFFKKLNSVRKDIFSNELKLGNVTTSDNRLLFFEIYTDNTIFKIYANISKQEFSIRENSDMIYDLNIKSVQHDDYILDSYGLAVFRSHKE